MKKIIYLSFVILACTFASCEYDNFDAPSLTVSGNLTYNGKNVLFDGNPARTLLKVVQSGFGKVDGGTALQVSDAGAFTQLLFAGEYWLTPFNNQYPFEFTQFENLGSGVGYDSIYIDLQDNLKMDIEVIPYYEISNYSVSLDGANMVMKFNAAKVTGTQKAAPAIRNIRCFVSTSKIVNSATTCAVTRAVNVTGGDLQISMPVTTYQNGYVNNFRDYAYCRIAIELDNIPNYYLFSEVLKLEGLPVKEWQ